jgi:hypothetical protein
MKTEGDRNDATDPLERVDYLLFNALIFDQLLDISSNIFFSLGNIID